MRQAGAWHKGKGRQRLVSGSWQRKGLMQDCWQSLGMAKGENDHVMIEDLICTRVLMLQSLRHPITLADNDIHTLWPS